MTKKQVLALSLAGVAGAIALSAGTLAYFTDKDSAVNNFTIGKVDISLLESQLHRVNAGASTDGRLKNDLEMLGAAGEAPEDAGGWAGAFYTDAQIEENAATYQSGYLATKGSNMVPGANVMKAPYIKNEGTVDAYVRVRVLVPKTLDDGILASSMYTGTAISSGATSRPVVTEVTREGVVYNEYAFTYLSALEPGQLTFWNAWGDIKLSEDTTEADIQALIENGDLTDERGFGVIVEADGIQAGGFDSAAAAFEAYDAQN